MKLGKMLPYIVMVGLTAGVGLAQDGGGPGGPGGGGFGGGRPTMEQIRERMATRMKEQLGVNDEEWKALQPKVEKVQQLQFQQNAGRMGGFRGRGGPGGPGG